NIRVNAIGPGYVRTEMTAQTLDQPEARAVINAKTAMGRPADRNEIAGAAVYLASKASSYVTGAILMVDGGLTRMSCREGRAPCVIGKRRQTHALHDANDPEGLRNRRARNHARRESR